MSTRDTVHKFMLEYQDEHNKPPTMEDISNAVGALNFKSSARHTLETLVEDGRVKVDGTEGESRRYQAIKPPIIAPLPSNIWPDSGNSMFISPYINNKL